MSGKEYLDAVASSDEHMEESKYQPPAAELSVEYRFENYGAFFDTTLSCELLPGCVLNIGNLSDKPFVSLMDNSGNTTLVEDFPAEQLFKLAKGLMQLVYLLGDPYKRRGDIDVSGI